MKTILEMEEYLVGVGFDRAEHWRIYRRGSENGFYVNVFLAGEGSCFCFLSHPPGRVNGSMEKYRVSSEGLADRILELEEDAASGPDYMDLDGRMVSSVDR